MPEARPIVLRLSLLPERYGVCRLAPDLEVPRWVHGGSFSSVTRTENELSLVCAEAMIPPEIHCERGWRVLRLEGPFAFDMIGVLLAVLAPLAQAGVSVFTLSTFNTDYVLVSETSLARAGAALKRAGHEFIA